VPKTTKSLQITENKALGGKHNVGDKLNKAKNEVRFSWEGDLRGRAMGYFTIDLYLIKVNNGTSNAVGVFKRRCLTCQTAIVDKLYRKLFMTTETQLMGLSRASRSNLGCRRLENWQEAPEWRSENS
jgi:hypothetical protein